MNKHDLTLHKAAAPAARSDAASGEEARDCQILKTLSPALARLASMAGLDPENPDYEQLVQFVLNPGQPRAAEPAMNGFYAHMEKLCRQAKELQAVFPCFDLRRELQNPVFLRLTSPGVGLSVEDAFHAVHRRKIQQMTAQAAARRTQELMASAIASGSHRPRESGTAAQAPSVSRFDYRKATAEQRRALKEEIRRAAAQGRKVYPG